MEKNRENFSVYYGFENVVVCEHVIFLQAINALFA